MKLQRVFRRCPRPTLGVLLLAGALGACSDENTAPTAAPELLETGADMVQTGMRTYITVNGVRDGEIIADTAYFYQDSSVVILTNPTLTLYTEQNGVPTGAQRARVEAEWGKLYENSQEMVARGNVILIIQEGNRRVETAELHYDPNADRIWSDSLTVLREEGVVSTGLGFESDLEFRQTKVGPGSIRNTGSGGGIRF